MNEFVKFERIDYAIEKFKIGKVWFFWNAEAIRWIDKQGNWHEIPRGLVSDGFSVPKLLWIFIRGLVSVLAALPHDDAYARGDMHRDVADENIREMILATHQPEEWWSWIRRKLYSAKMHYTAFKVWLGLRIGGRVAWENYEAKRAGGYDIIKERFADTLDEAKLKAERLLSSGGQIV